MIEKATKYDVDWMVDLSHQKRLAYSIVHPNFYKMAKNSDEVQKGYFLDELPNKDVIALTYREKQGFIMGKIINPPDVYDSGLTLMIDDFCVANDSLWMIIGKALLDECQKIAKEMGAVQVLVVCGDHDQQKSRLLKDLNMKIASNWFNKLL
jgi:hypothetical protein